MCAHFLTLFAIEEYEADKEVSKMQAFDLTMVLGGHFTLKEKVNNYGGFQV